MPASEENRATIVEAKLAVTTVNLRLEWKMVIKNGKFVFPFDVLQIRLYCRPFPDFGEPNLIYPPLSHVAYTRSRGVEGAVAPPVVSIGGSAGWEITQEAFRPGSPTEPEGERYGYYPLDLHLRAIRLTINNGTVAAKIEWPIEQGWTSGKFRCWASFGYLVPTPGPTVGHYEAVASTEAQHYDPTSRPEPIPTVDPAGAPYVFISYERDSAFEADDLRARLEDLGFPVWQDVEKIRGTARWPVAINQALRETDRILLLLTPKSMQSDEVFNEWFFYYSEQKPIHCLLLDTCDIHYQLRPFQYLDWRNTAKRDLHKLIDELTAPFEWPSVARKEKVINTEFAPVRDLPEAMQALHEALLNDTSVVALTDGQLQDIAQHTAIDETQQRLARYAAWCGPRYQLDERFVRLTMLLQSEQGWQPQGETRRFQDLREVLAEETSHTLVLLGNPGAGKSTLLRRLEMDIASDALRTTASRTLTFFVSLAEYGHGDIPFENLETPFEWLSAKWANQCPMLPDLDTLLHERRMLLLLDALNEMPHADRDDFERRADLWRAFLYDYIRDRPGNRALFACRTLDYGAVLSSEPYPVPQVRLEAMTPEQVRDYLDNYAPEHADLIWDSFHDDPRRLELFRIPFMLKLLVDRVRLDGRVPQGRAETFNGFVYSLLRREVVDKKPPAPLFRPDGLLTRRDVNQLKRQIAPLTPYALPEHGLLVPSLIALAHAMQARTPGEEKGLVAVDIDDAPGLLPQAGERAEDVLAAGCAMTVLDQTDDDYIRYYHQLVQEFFAARKLAHEPDPDLVRVEWRVERVSPTLDEELNRIGGSDPLPLLPGTGWEETTVMAAAMSADPDAFARGLMDANLPLAGRCAAAPDVNIQDALCDEIRWSLVARTQDAHADLRARIAAGLALGEVGDPRFERHTGPHGNYLLPPLIPIEGGEYTLGSDDGLYDDEEPVHPVTVDAFEMAQFPVTNAEYKLFMDAGGYEDEQWWDTEAAKAWRRGEGVKEGENQRWREVRDYLKSNLEQYVKRADVTSEAAETARQLVALSEEEFEGLLEESTSDQRYMRPAFLDDSAYNSQAQPVVGICWYEARAYCAWLSAQSGRNFRLPTEAEWEAAARGKSARRYPYGPDFDVALSNTFESHIRRTTPIGVFPGGETPAGLVDMSGNVYDWTTSIYDQERFPYPYRADDGREDSADAAATRVVRGGSWGNNQAYARGAFRLRDDPLPRSYYIGFRVVCVPHL